MSTPEPPAVPDAWWSPSENALYVHPCDAADRWVSQPVAPHRAASWAVPNLPADAVRLVPDTRGASWAAEQVRGMQHPRWVLCPAGEHPSFFVDSPDTIGCPWCGRPAQDTGQGREPVMTETTRGLVRRLAEQRRRRSNAETRASIATHRSTRLLRGVGGAVGLRRPGYGLPSERDNDVELIMAAALRQRADLLELRHQLRDEESGDTVQAPDVDWLARFCAAAEAADNQGWAGTAVNLYDLASQLSPNDEDDSDAVIEAIGRALLGTDTAAPLTERTLADDPGLPLSALFDNRDPHQDEMRAGTDTAEPGPVYVKPDEELPHA